MRMPTLPVLVLSLLLGACTEPPRDSAVSTAAGPKPEGGIGGTGAPADVAELPPGGIGGTGIFGQITGFGSVLINGRTVEIPADLDAEGLSIGSTVLIEARDGSGELVAERIRAFRPIEGKVEAIGRGALSIMNTPVRYKQSTPVFDKNGERHAVSILAAGMRVAVSGIWRRGGIEATRIDMLPNDSTSAIRGLLAVAGAGGRIAGTRIALPKNHALPALGYAELKGNYERSRLDATPVRDASLFSQSIDHLIVQAAVALDPDGEGYHLSGFGIPVGPDTSAPAKPGEIVIFEGPFDGTFSIEAATPSP